MSIRPFRFALACAAAGFVSDLWAASPQLSGVRPQGGQVGTEIEVVFGGDRLADAEEIIFYEPGIKALEISAPKDNSDKSRKVKLKIEPNCRLGEHAVRVRTKSGVSQLKTFHVGPLAILEEKEPNSEFVKPQILPKEAVDAGVTVVGSVSGDDLDFYAVECKAGERLSIEVEGLRLGNAMFDPAVSVYDADRTEIAAADDHPFNKQDPVLTVKIPRDGLYVIELRESSYQGGSGYRAHIGRFPRPTVPYPAGGKRGENLQVRFLGDALGEISQSVTLPKEGTEFLAFPQDSFGKAPSGNPLRISEFANTLEVEPNDDPARATPAAAGNALNGIIEKAGDVDYFRLPLKKGQVAEIQCFARRIRSQLDPVLNVCGLKGNVLAGNDDAGGSQDSTLRYTAPADGEYLIRVTDHLGRGGPAFVYRVELLVPESTVRVTIPQFARYSQERNTIVVPRGNRYATILTADKLNFSGDVLVSAEGLPKGVKLTAPAMAKSMNIVPVLVEAAADAPLAYKNVDLAVTDPEKKLKGSYRQACDLVQGPNQQTYWTKITDKLTVAVAEEAPFRLELAQPKVPLVKNGAMDLKVKVSRKEGFKGAINVQFPFRPNGVNASTGITIPPDQTEATFPISAAGNAEPRKWQVCVIASADVNGPLWVSSGFVDLDLTEPFLTFAWNRDAVSQGETAELTAKVTVNTPFEGKATARLVGIPDKLKCEPQVVTKDTAELVFKIPTDANSPVGKHPNLFAQVVIEKNGEPILHNLGTTQIQIDKPSAKPAPKAPVAKPAPKK